MRIYISICVILVLITSLFDMPYAYYSYANLVVFIGMSFIAYKCYKEEWWLGAVIYTLISIAFNPLDPLHFEKETWKVIDIITISFIIIFESINFFKRNYNIVKK